MTRKIFIPILTTVALAVMTSCGGDSTTATSTRHFADVIFSNDFKVVLNVTELDFDPIEYTQEKVRDGFRQALDQLKNR